ncbi:MAG: phosphoribosylanthranilate isomerase [Methylacidiphilales bacterium]|nr:phosphoribosylanthranilate isomerase [Candidatus Methylacidiphilales bacterium]
MKLRIKLCGLKNHKEIEIACKYGVYAIGLVFVQHSVRKVTIHRAKSLCLSALPLVQLVGVFMNPTKQFVNQVIRSVPLNMLQFHGIEREAFCKSFSLPYLKSIPINSVGWKGIARFIKLYPSASGFLIDSHKANQMGGTGTISEWEQVPKSIQHKLILSGGIHVKNIIKAHLQTGITQFDISSGIESSRGVKDTRKIVALLRHSLK